MWLYSGEADETFFEFSVDVDAAGVDDSLGNPLVQASLADPVISGGQKLDLLPSEDPTPIGPHTGDTANDGYGFGADDDLPGVVIVAKHGPGIVYDPLTGLTEAPLKLRNLAGFINAVAYELNSTRKTTTLIAHMNVPSFLVAPVIVFDDNYVDDGDPATTNVNVLWRIDGTDGIVVAEDFIGESILIGTFNSYPDVVDEFRYEVGVMAVSGIAPDYVVDMNGDYEIDHRDLKAMGYKVLGKKKTVSLDLWPGQECFGGTGNIVASDLNNDGNASAVAACPTGPGSVSKPPR